MRDLQGRVRRLTIGDSASRTGPRLRRALEGVCDDIFLLSSHCTFEHLMPDEQALVLGLSRLGQRAWEVSTVPLTFWERTRLIVLTCGYLQVSTASTHWFTSRQATEQGPSIGSVASKTGKRFTLN